MDDDLTHRIAVAAQARGLDVVHAKQEGIDGRDDPAHLAHAADQGRCLISANVTDYLAATEAAQRQGAPHAGVILLYAQPRRTDVDRFVAALAGFDEQHPGGLPPYTKASLPYELWRRPR